MRPLLVLVGPPASGKTTVGTAVAAALGIGFRDTDADVEAETGTSVADLFVTEGEPHFRALEAAAVARALQTVDVTTGEAAVSINQRSDVCAVPRASVVMEAMVALVLADAVLEKFGGDSVPETRRNLQSYLDSLQIR